MIVTEISEDELAGLSEFSLLSENAEQAGVSGPLPDVERVEAGVAEGRISALRWGALSRQSPPRIIFLHGGGQNAHTWDTVIVGVGEPALAVDLPGHGHSAWRATTHPSTTPRPWRRCCTSSHRPPNSWWACRWAG
jgi:esterase